MTPDEIKLALSDADTIGEIHGIEAEMRGDTLAAHVRTLVAEVERLQSVADYPTMLTTFRGLTDEVARLRTELALCHRELEQAGDRVLIERTDKRPPRIVDDPEE